MATDSLFATVALSGLNSVLGGIACSSEQKLRLEIPKAYAKADIARLQKDCELLGGILKSHPEKVIELLQAVKSNQLAKAQKTAVELGLTEAAFLEKEGGLAGLVIAIVVIAILFFAEPAN